ncbi:lysozyme-like domain-containing protein [Mucor mucedo]|uniref:lysozyme-like domain-containing protein n=1 Tax=Mucor mucedo TaxID=29922 RepID=UPI00221F23C4|nr:lysozyme-like domain-containing protein [Mucor mucedo]KAI7896555.1 lysozyme-like domain-containing protein [Mucor mucedo]
MASLITNVFEDGDANFAFASCNDINDLRGYTSGYAGFTTGTGDSETLIESYTLQDPNNTLAPFLEAIHQISALPHCDRKNRGNTSSLEGFCEAWKEEACDPSHAFSKLQRDWVYENYMIPSARYAAQSGVHSPLGQAIFYDTIIQHGFQYVEPDINIVRVLTLTGPKGTDEPEESFLKRFLTTRRELQCCYPDDVWPASATRSEDFLTLLNDFEYNKDLNVPIKLKNFERTITGNEDSVTDAKRCL